MRPIAKLLLLSALVMLLGGWTWRPFGFEEKQDMAGAGQIGDVEAGRRAFETFGCGSCHLIRGMGDARGRVGPPLDGIGRRIYIAGALRNTPSTMVKWLQDPQEVEPETVMPDLALTEEQARNITAYLYSLD